MKTIIFILLGVLTGIGCINFFISAIASLLVFSIGGLLINGLLCYASGLLTKKMFENAK